MILKFPHKSAVEAHLKDGRAVLYSYGQPVAARLEQGRYVVASGFISRTTQRHIDEFTRRAPREMRDFVLPSEIMRIIEEV